MPRNRTPRICLECGVSFYRPKMRRAQRYCSNSCARQSPASQSATRISIAKAQSTKKEPTKVEIMCPLNWRQCPDCGVDRLLPRGQAGGRCESCRLGYRRAGSWAYYHRVTKPRDGFGARTGTCPECGVEFTGHGRKFCGSACRRRAGKAQRNAFRRGASIGEMVYRRRVYERDGFNCHLCGKSLRMDTTSPHPLSPTLDHVIPISLNGSHSYANVRAAHFICNSKRGNRGAAQLILA